MVGSGSTLFWIRIRQIDMDPDSQETTLGPLFFLSYIKDLPLSANLLTFLFADEAACLDTDSNLLTVH